MTKHLFLLFLSPRVAACWLLPGASPPWRPWGTAAGETAATEPKMKRELRRRSRGGALSGGAPSWGRGPRERRWLLAFCKKGRRSSAEGRGAERVQRAGPPRHAQTGTRWNDRQYSENQLFSGNWILFDVCWFLSYYLSSLHWSGGERQPLMISWFYAFNNFIPLI